jgi:dipeptidyl aminopeptidase/acylaminoacyl peptidase
MMYIKTIAVRMLLLSGIVALAQEKRSITPLDCVNVKYIYDDIASAVSGVQINPQENRVAYLVKSPNLDTNENDIQLYVADITRPPYAPKLLFTGTPVLQMQWLEDGSHLTFLAKDAGMMSVREIDVRSGDVKTLVRAQKDINEYSVDASGSAVVYTQEDYDGHFVFHRTEKESARGYRLTQENLAGESVGTPTRKLFLAKRSASGKWENSEELQLHAPVAHELLGSIPYYRLMMLRMSPNGKHILLRYLWFFDKVPSDWGKNSFVKTMMDHGDSDLCLLVEYNTEDKSTTIPLKTPAQAEPPVWSPDSTSFAVRALSPVGSQYEQEDAARQNTFQNHLFWVKTSGYVEKITAEYNDQDVQPLLWTSPSTLLTFRTNVLSQWQNTAGSWVNSSTKLISSDNLSTDDIGVSRSYVVGEFQNKLTPPEVRIYNVDLNTSATMARLNPQFDTLALAAIKPVSWPISNGHIIHGDLFMPLDYTPGKRYPLLIETKPGGNKFQCDSGSNHYPSFIPQPAASAEIMYLTRTYDGETYDDDLKNEPSGYPGQIGEAAYHAEVWDSAVDALDKQGIIDRNKVGIIGFSRTGWYTEFALMFGKTRYQAATVTDNAEYGFLTYTLRPDPVTIKSDNNMYGGPPENDTLDNWLKYNVSFNAFRIHTPVLRETMGYGVQYDDERKRPLSIDTSYTLLSVLTRLHRPIEAYYYPNDEHETNHPQARLATLQRNLDWYRFWLQGYERPDPEDKDQYVRWRQYRVEQEAQDKAAGQSPTSPSKLN